MEPVQYLQGFSGLCWTAVMLLAARSVWRTFFGVPTSADKMRSAFCYMGILQAGFVLRWVLWPQTVGLMRDDELQLWTALYALCGLLALWVLSLIGEYRGR